MLKVNVQSLHFHADSKLVDYVEKKLSKLGRYVDRNVEAEVLLKLQDTGSKFQDKITEVRLHVPGGWMIDKKIGSTFESAIDNAVETLKRQLLKHKEKASNHQRTPIDAVLN